MKYYLLFTLLFLCGTCLSAQNLNQEEFKNVHDRIVIAFTKAIMPNYVGSKDCSQKDKDSYEQKIKDKLFNNEISSVEELSELLENNSFSTFVEKFINNFIMQPQALTKRTLYDNLRNKLNNNNLIKYANSNEISYEAIFPYENAGVDNSLKDIGHLKEQLQNVSKRVEKMQEKLLNNNRNSHLTKTVIPILGVDLVLFVILAFWLSRLQRQLNRLKKQIGKKTRSTQKENNIEWLESKFQMQQEQIGRLKSDIQLVRQQIETKPKDRTMEQTPSNTVVLEVSPLPVSENKNKVIYAQIRNGNLEKVYEKERQYYKITCEQGRNEGTFELVDTPDLLIRAIKDKEAYIEPVCETCGIARTAKSIKTIIPGHVTTSDGEIWEVKNKAKIEYI